MGKYRKVDPRIWNDLHFLNLSDKAKLVFLFLLTHPHMTALGAMRASQAGLAAELQWDQKDFAKAFAECFRKPLLKVDETHNFLWILNFMKYNQPENPNVFKSWESALDYLPECNLKYQLIQEVKAFAEGLGEAFVKALPKAFRSPLPKQEQEQEQEHITGINTSVRSDSENESSEQEEIQIFTEMPCKGDKPVYPIPKNYIEEMKVLYPGVDIEKETLRAKGWLINNPKKGKTFNGMKRYLGGWYDREQNKAGGNYGGSPGSTSPGKPTRSGPKFDPDKIKKD